MGTICEVDSREEETATNADANLRRTMLDVSERADADDGLGHLRTSSLPHAVSRQAGFCASKWEPSWTQADDGEAHLRTSSLPHVTTQHQAACAQLPEPDEAAAAVMSHAPFLDREEIHARLARIMSGRVEMPNRALGSASDDQRLNLPALLGDEQRILLGDIGHVECLLDDEEGSDAMVCDPFAQLLRRLQLLSGSLLSRSLLSGSLLSSSFQADGVRQTIETERLAREAEGESCLRDNG